MLHKSELAPRSPKWDFPFLEVPPQGLFGGLTGALQQDLLQHAGSFMWKTGGQALIWGVGTAEALGVRLTSDRD